MSLQRRVEKLERTKAPKQKVEILLPEWISPKPIRFESKQFGTADIIIKVPDYMKRLL